MFTVTLHTLRPASALKDERMSTLSVSCKNIDRARWHAKMHIPSITSSATFLTVQDSGNIIAVYYRAKGQARHMWYSDEATLSKAAATIKQYAR